MAGRLVKAKVSLVVLTIIATVPSRLKVWPLPAESPND